jgi:CubicO group peptidase (beta-lactamase class C family)
MKLIPLLIALFTGTCFAHNAEFGSILSKIKDKYSVPGIAGAMSVNGEMSLIGSSGVRKIGSEIRLETKDKFHLGSCTKSMTATVAATFVEEGKLNWDDKLSKFFPNLEIHQDFNDVTFDMLLAHYSGLEADPNDDLYEMLSELETPVARNEVSKIFLKNKPKFSPGTGNYSNIGYIIAGNILERLSGKTWEILVSERLFSPLGMSTCSFGPTSDPLETIITQPWGHYEENGIISPVHFDNALFYGPAGSVHCSLEDWNKYLSVHIDGFNGKSGILKSKTFKKLHTPYPASAEVYTYGAWIRLERNWAGGPVLMHTGSNVVNYANVWLAPKINSSIVSTLNIGGEIARNASNEVIEQIITNYVIQPKTMIKKSR